jgi:hypothetical protein
MKNLSMLRRPIGRIDHVLSRLKRLWHYYPGHSLYALVLETTICANHAESELPGASIDDIEDIAYPEGHLFHGIRHLEMGIDWLERDHANEPLPPVPIQTAILGKFAERWRRLPDMRLGQLLRHYHHMAEEHEQRLANG